MSDFRLNEIARIRQEFEAELSQRKKMKSKYSKAIKIVDSIRHGLNSGGIVLGIITPVLFSTVVGAPIAIISGVGAGLSAVGGVLLLPVKCKLSHKLKNIQVLV